MRYVHCSIIVIWVYLLITGFSFAESDELIEQALQGDAEAQYSLGKQYYEGHGRPQNNVEAYIWFKLARDEIPSAAVKFSKAADALTLDELLIVEKLFRGRKAEIGPAKRRHSERYGSFTDVVKPVGGPATIPHSGSLPSYAQAVRLFNAKEYDAAFSPMLLAAERGNPRAQLYVGGMYMNGLGVPLDFMKAMEWYEKAASQGLQEAEGIVADLKAMDAEFRKKYPGEPFHWMILDTTGPFSKRIWTDVAQQSFERASSLSPAERNHASARMYYEGQGVPPNYAKAYKLWRQAADQGLPEAQACLGYLYEMGHGVPKDYRQAFEWYTKAVRQGDRDALNNLGVLYDDGLGVEQDSEKAFDLFTQAAWQGNDLAQCNLAEMYFAGRGTRLDYVEAYAWASLSTEKDDECRSLLEAVTAKLSDTAIQQADELFEQRKEEIRLRLEDTKGDGLTQAVSPKE